jgi:hypothetical protein
MARSRVLILEIAAPSLVDVDLQICQVGPGLETTLADIA